MSSAIQREIYVEDDVPLPNLQQAISEYLHAYTTFERFVDDNGGYMVVYTKHPLARQSIAAWEQIVAATGGDRIAARDAFNKRLLESKMRKNAAQAPVKLVYQQDPTISPVHIDDAPEDYEVSICVE